MTCLRQTKEWSNHLSYWGWKTELLPRDGLQPSTHHQEPVKIHYKKTLFGTVAKLQHPSHLSKRSLDTLEQMAKKHKFLFVKIEPEAEEQQKVCLEHPLSKSTSPIAPTKTLRIDLTKSQITLYHELSKSCKYSVNRAQREGVTIDITQNPSHQYLKKLSNIIELSQEVRPHQKISINMLKNTTAAFGNKSFIAIAKNKNGDNLAGSFFVAANDTAHYLYGGTTFLGRKSKGGYLMFWKAIMHFKKLGYKHFDFEGIYDHRFHRATSSWKGFTTFKKKFGGYELEYPEPTVMYINPILKFLAKISMFGM